MMKQRNDENDEVRYNESEKDENNEMRNDENDENDDSGNNENDETRNDEVRNNESSDRDENHQGVRRSKREHKQKIKINPDEIGECDDENDKDYK